MPTWRKLYSVMFLAMAALMVAALDFPFHQQVHVLLGLGTLAWTLHNRSILLKLPVPGRVLRTAKSNLPVGILTVVTGALLFAPLPGWVIAIFKGLHVLAITALITHMASVATGHDMWLTKELANDSKAA